MLWKLFTWKIISAGFRFLWRIKVYHWYRKFPFIPRPSFGYVKWRLQTAYGDGRWYGSYKGRSVSIKQRLIDLVKFLEWCNEMEELIRRRR